MYCLSTNQSGKQEIRSFTMSNGLANNTVKGIVEDQQGMLWIATDHGLSVFNPKTETFSSFYKNDGLLSAQFYFNGAIRSRSGVIYLGTDCGMQGELVGEGLHGDAGELLLEGVRDPVHEIDVQVGAVSQALFGLHAPMAQADFRIVILGYPDDVGIRHLLVQKIFCVCDDLLEGFRVSHAGLAGGAKSPSVAQRVELRFGGRWIFRVVEVRMRLQIILVREELFQRVAAFHEGRISSVIHKLVSS